MSLIQKEKTKHYTLLLNGVQNQYITFPIHLLLLINTMYIYINNSRYI